MATIPQILSCFWQGAEWRVDGDEYATLDWAAANTLPKPTESEIRARSSEADVIIADTEQRARQQRAMIDAPDYLLKAIEILIEGMVEIRRVVNDIRTTTIPAAHTGDFTTWDSSTVAKIAALRQKVIDLRNVS